MELFLIGAVLLAAAVVGSGAVTWVWVFEGIRDDTALRFAVWWGTVFWVGVVLVWAGSGLT